MKHPSAFNFPGVISSYPDDGWEPWWVGWLDTLKRDTFLYRLQFLMSLWKKVLALSSSELFYRDCTLASNIRRKPLSPLKSQTPVLITLANVMQGHWHVKRGNAHNLHFFCTWFYHLLLTVFTNVALPCVSAPLCCDICSVLTCHMSLSFCVVCLFLWLQCYTNVLYLSRRDDLRLNKTRKSLSSSHFFLNVQCSCFYFYQIICYNWVSYCD